MIEEIPLNLTEVSSDLQIGEFVYFIENTINV